MRSGLVMMVSENDCTNVHKKRNSALFLSISFFSWVALHFLNKSVYGIIHNIHHPGEYCFKIIWVTDKNF